MQSDRHIAISPTVLDHDPWLLNTPAGIVDLRTGTLGTPDPDQMCTRSTAVPPDFAGVAPRWEQFLEESTGGDASLIRYLQRLAGYCLTGVTTEQMFAFLHGGGGNGKGTFINTIAGILRDYAVAASMDTFTASKHDRHTTELAMLQGARLVTASETQAGRSWDEARVKLLTGGDPITARFMREDNFTYLPQFKLVFLGNHRPAIRDLDRAMKRRLHLVPFTFEPKVVDTALGAKLRDEWPAILAWMIQGCLAWQAEGLTAPGSVQAATEDYFRDEDAVGRWLDECCTRGEGATTTHDLFQSWREWANQNGEYDGSIRRLSAALITRGFAKWRHPESRRNGFAGITLKDVGNVALT